MSLKGWLVEKIRNAVGTYEIIGSTNSQLTDVKNQIADMKKQMTVQNEDVITEIERALEYLPDSLKHTRSVYDTLRGMSFPIYISEGGIPLVSPVEDKHLERIALISMPKAGTYLLSEHFKLLGFTDSGIHISNTSFTDYRFKTIKEKKEEYYKFEKKLPIEGSVNLIGRGQFVVGHISHTPEALSALKNFKKIFIVRDLRDAMVSHMRFFSSKGRAEAKPTEWKQLEDGPQQMLEFMTLWGDDLFPLIQSMIGWDNEKDILKLKFETIYGDNGKEEQLKSFQNLCSWLELPKEIEEIKRIIEIPFGQETKTWSGNRSNISLYWNDEVERLFIKLGGDKINRELGYNI